MTSAAPPGMYQDPEDPAQLRWWDGSQWTDHRPQPAAVAAPVQSPPTHAGNADSGRVNTEPAAVIPTAKPHRNPMARLILGPSQPAPTRPAVVDPDRVSQVSGLAVAALVAGLLTFSIVAIPCGHMAIYNIKHSGGTQKGYPMAVTGALLGWIWLSIGVVGLFLQASMGSQ